MATSEVGGLADDRCGAEGAVDCQVPSLRTHTLSRVNRKSRIPTTPVLLTLPIYITSTCV